MLVNEDVSQAPCGDINLYNIVTLFLEMFGNLVGGYHGFEHLPVFRRFKGDIPRCRCVLR